MAGRVREEDIAAVREKSPIQDVIGEHVQLRNAGGGNLKGICPFHDEKSPSLSVSPARGLFHCFGCGAGGDVIRFVERIDHLSFNEALESLAARAGVQLRYEDSGGGTSAGGSRPSGLRARLVEAHQMAAAFYAEQLLGPEGEPGRQFLTERGFDSEVARQFGCGFAPSGWDSLTKYLLSRGFSTTELVQGGLSKQGSRGSLIDRFHRRLLWPIRDVGGDVVGFGARRLFDDDRIEAKYLNTGETPIYKKSQLLYGIDLAKRSIAREHTAVVVEGYTDVMACHLAGITTAVATCGTAFGAEHIAVLRRLLMDSDTFGSKVVFTFDGDAAGMKAAERAFADEQKFVAQTYVAIEKSGKDPCELRQAGGDAAVRALVAGAVPLLEFVLATTVSRFDLETVEGRAAALDAGVPLVAGLKDRSRQDAFARKLAGLVGIDDPNRVAARIRGYQRSANAHATDGAQKSTESAPVSASAVSASADGAVPAKLVALEREVLKCALQLPATVGPTFDGFGEDAFLVPLHRELTGAIARCGGASGAAAGPQWAERIAAQLGEGTAARAAVNALSVEPLRERPEHQDRYAAAVVTSLAEKVLAREIAQLRSRMQRLSAADDHTGAGEVMIKLIDLERSHRELRAMAIGGE